MRQARLSAAVRSCLVLGQTPKSAFLTCVKPFFFGRATLEKAADYGKKDADMDYFKGRVVKLLVDYFGEDFRRITHALEVLNYAERIAEVKPGSDPQVLVACALLHDIGIKLSEEELGHNNGKTQEAYGPPVAEKLLRGMGFPDDKTDRVCRIIGNHHSASRYDYVELEILKQADAVVNRLDGDRLCETSLPYAGREGLL